MTSYRKQKDIMSERLLLKHLISTKYELALIIEMNEINKKEQKQDKIKRGTKENKR